MYLGPVSKMWKNIDLTKYSISFYLNIEASKVKTSERFKWYKIYWCPAPTKYGKNVLVYLKKNKKCRLLKKYSIFNIFINVCILGHHQIPAT
jgi:hypothetical protein